MSWCHQPGGQDRCAPCSRLSEFGFEHGPTPTIYRHQHTPPTPPTPPLQPNWIERVLWALKFSVEVEFKINGLYGGGRCPPGKRHGRDSVDIGSEDLFGRGVALRNLPLAGTPDFDLLCGAYQSATALLAMRPWSTFRRFEVSVV